ncbi:hypothetical protein FDECE_12278 [Fusarium decemcellulare]|nr:hypothetical protein FDECE_12278 [Fusarium decemcellulare]
MAEPISLAASVAGLLDIGLRTSKALHSLQRELRNAPDMIRALSNEVEDIKAVLARVEDTIKDSEASGLNSTVGAGIIVNIDEQLAKAKVILADMDSLAQKLIVETPTLKRVKWCLKKSRAAELQTDLKEVQDVQIGIQQHQQAVIQQLDTTSQTISNQFISAQHLDSQRHAEIAATLQVLQASLSNLPQSLNDQLAVVRDEIAKFNQARVEIETKPTRLVSDTRGSIPSTSNLTPPLDSRTGRVFTHVPDVMAHRLHLDPGDFPEYLTQSSVRFLSATRDIRFHLPVATASVLDIFHVDGRSALHFAVQSQRSSWAELIQVIKILLQAGADPDQENDAGVSARLEIAQLSIIKNIPKELEALFNTSECISNLEMTFLHQVVAGHCHVDLVAAFQSRSPDLLSQVNARDRFGHTPLMYAAKCGDVHKAKALLDAGAGVNEQSPEGWTALMHLAIHRSRCVELGSLLLTAGAGIYATNREGGNAVHMAVYYDNTELIELLASKGARMDCRDRDGLTPLHWAIGYNSLEALRCLYDQGADIDEVDENGDSLLNLAISSRLNDAQRVLLELGANHLTRNEFGTLLHYAAHFGDEGTFNTLASVMLPGLDINSEDDWGRTAVDCFENRSRVSDVVRSAFYALLEVVGSNQLKDVTEEDWSDSDDDFEDTSEFLDDSGIPDQD